jgi:type II secretory pathway component PulC
VPVAATPSPVSLAAAVPPSVVSSPAVVLHGVVVKGELAIAYLEDPVTKHIKGYRVGDSIAGSTVQAIAPDRVVLAYAGGLFTARLGQAAQQELAVSPKAGAATPARIGPPATGVKTAVVSQERQAIEERLLPARRRMHLEAWLAARPGEVVQAP